MKNQHVHPIFESILNNAKIPIIQEKDNNKYDELLSEIMEIVDKEEYLQDSNEFKIWKLINDFKITTP